MKVAVLAHFFYPWRAAGSETVLLELLKAAQAAGHDTEVWCTHSTAERVWRGNLPITKFEGVTVRRVGNPIMAAKAMARTRPHVVVSHHQHAALAVKTAKQVGARSVYLTHNQMGVVNRGPLRARPDLTIHNSRWVRESLAEQFGEHGDHMVMHPPLTPDRHTVPSTGDGYTLCNLNEHKGAHLFYKLAETMPERKFVGVIGGHGKQIIRRNIPNVTLLDHGPDMRRVWSATRVLLMPSIYESYGLTAVEAGINGIPTIANPTPGLVENLGPNGLFADRDDIAQWEDVIRDMDFPTRYQLASEHARAVAENAMAATRRSLTDWVSWLEGPAHGV